MEAAELRESVRSFALGLPEAWEDFPWGDCVIKVRKKIFVFLSSPESDSPGFCVKLTDPDQHAHALSLPGAELPGYGLGKHGWVNVPFTPGATPLDLLHDWTEESYRAVAPKSLLK